MGQPAWLFRVCRQAGHGFSGAVWTGQAKAKMFEDIPDDRWVFDAADDPHDPLTFRANQRIDLIYFLNKPRPVPSKHLFIPQRFEDTGNEIIATFLLPFPPLDIAVIAVVPDHLLAPVRDVRRHGGQPFRRREDLGCLAAFGSINDRSLLIQVLHPFLGE